jgi:hypothetical protein
MRRHWILAMWTLLVWARSGGASSFLDVTPGFLEVSAEPGRTIRGDFKVLNTRADNVTVSIQVKDGWIEQRGVPSPVAPDEWLHLKIPKKLVLRSGGTKTIPYRIDVPGNLNGEAMALVFFSVPSDPTTGQPLNIQLRHGIPIYLSAKGTERVELRVVDAQALVPPSGGLELAMTLYCDGNTHVRPRGDLRITDTFNQEVETLPLEYGAPVFPGGRGKYHARARRTYWATGHYKALLTVTYGDTFGPLKTLQKSFLLNVSEGKVVMTEEVPHGG